METKVEKEMEKEAILMRRCRSMRDPVQPMTGRTAARAAGTVAG